MSELTDFILIILEILKSYFELKKSTRKERNLRLHDAEKFDTIFRRKIHETLNVFNWTPEEKKYIEKPL